MKQDLDKLDVNFAPRRVEAGVQWVDVRELGVEGRGFEDTEVFYDRFPARAKGVVPDAVWNLSRHSAGMCVRFVTDAAVISARWTLRFEPLAMDHMPATGVSGLDLYVRRAQGWRWLGQGRPTKFPTNEAALTGALDAVSDSAGREMMLYLPLYNGVSEVLVGVPEGASIGRAPAWSRGKGDRAGRTDRIRPICFYGTSIVHGGCASRPGMAYPALISRRLDHPHWNFGFSGNGRSEPEVAKLLAELDAAAYVLDPLPNMSAEQVDERMEKFAEILRAAHPQTPIVLVENITYQHGHATPAPRDGVLAKNRALGRAHAKLLAGGMKHLHLVGGADLLGDDGEGTVDGVHPTDLGFVRMAEVIGRAVESAMHDR